MSAEYTVEEARRIAKRVVERQKARSGGVEMALWDGHWGFLELKDAPYDAAALIRAHVRPLLAAE